MKLHQVSLAKVVLVCCIFLCAVLVCLSRPGVVESRTLTVKKYVDVDNDGVIGGDDFLYTDGWEFKACEEDNTENSEDVNCLSGTTGEDGTFSFDVSDSETGRVFICEVEETGWTLTYRQEVLETEEVSGYENCTTLAEGDSDYTINFANAKDDTRWIKVEKYIDVENDGTIGENDILYTDGWEFKACEEDNTANSEDVNCLSGTTDESGTVYFGTPDSGTGRVFICEVEETGWTLTYRQEVLEDEDVSGYENCTTLAEGDSNYTINFANAKDETRWIKVTKYEDTDGDGDIDEDSPLMEEGWEFAVYLEDDNTEPKTVAHSTGTTDDAGEVYFEVPSSDTGRVFICETTPEGWKLTYWQDGANDPVAGYENCTTMEEGSAFGDIRFGNVPLPKVEVWKYDDVNGDGPGVAESPDNPKAGWIFNLVDNSDQTVDDTVTDENGFGVLYLPNNYQSFRAGEVLNGWILTHVRRKEPDSGSWTEDTMCPSDPYDSTETFTADYDTVTTIEFYNWLPVCDIQIGADGGEEPVQVCAGYEVALSVSPTEGDDATDYPCTQPCESDSCWEWTASAGALSDPPAYDAVTWTAPNPAPQEDVVVSYRVGYGDSGNYGPCQDDITFQVTDAPTAVAGTDIFLCAADVPEGGIPLTGTAANYNSSEVSWTTTGGGSFSPDDALSTFYLPGEGDFGTTVQLTLTVGGIGPCVNPVSSQLSLTIGAPINCEITVDEAAQDGVVEPGSDHTASIPEPDALPATYEWRAEAFFGETTVDLIASPQPFGNAIEWTAPLEPATIKLNVKVTDANGCECEYDPPFETPINTEPSGMLLRVVRFIPSLTQWGLLGLAGLLGAAGQYRMRRRKNR